MSTQATRHNFSLAEINSKINRLERNGFTQYLNTWEKFTVSGEENLNHVILTCTKGHYDGWVVDIYYNENDKRCWLEYSTQHKDNNLMALA